MPLDKATDFEAVTGKGVTGTVGGRSIALGNTALMQAIGGDAASGEAKADALRTEGKTAMFVAVDGRVAVGVKVRLDHREGAAKQVHQPLIYSHDFYYNFSQ